MKIIITSIVALACIQLVAIAQQQPLSPRKSAEMMLNGKKISVDYGSPSVRGRKIFGDLVPFGKVWRLGANKATHFTTEADLMVGEVSVPKGTYTLYALPSESGWKLIINKQTGQWGTVYDEKQDLARIDMKSEKTKAPVEALVFSLAQSGKGGMIKVEWDNASAWVNFTEKK
jgi:hypothetical protein